MSSVLDKINYVALKTLEVHNDCNIGDNLKGYVSYRFDPLYFTSKDGARDLIKTVTVEDFTVEMIKFAMEAGSLYETVMESSEGYRDLLAHCLPCYKFYKKVQNNMIEPYVYLLSHNDVLADIAHSFGNLKYHTNGLYDKLISDYKITATYDLHTVFEKKKRVKNLKINRRNVNKCFKDLESGKQLKLASSKYSLDGKMFTASDIGFVKQTQEDATLILNHPQNKEYRLIAVCDGVGGCRFGGPAALYTLRNLAYWFNNLDVRDLDEPDEINPLLCTAVLNISNSLYERFHDDAACTLVLALVANGRTFVLSIGDSRCYIYKDGELRQITNDDSLVFKKYLTGEVSKDDLRFEEDNNIITKYIGGKSRGIFDIKCISNYDLLLLFTDGVTDILSDTDIKLLCDTTPSDKLAKVIVESSKYSSIRKKITLENGDLYEKVIKGGKDNTTAGVLIGR